ncbi:MAG: helix-turn-helix domain-containing protein [Treponema sp.]|nr:helix-turn-helix domain-containing protein [Treponema sp.]
MESGNYNPTLDFLHKIAKAIGKDMEERMAYNKGGFSSTHFRPLPQEQPDA